MMLDIQHRQTRRGRPSWSFLLLVAAAIWCHFGAEGFQPRDQQWKRRDSRVRRRLPDWTVLAAEPSESVSRRILLSATLLIFPSVMSPAVAVTRAVGSGEYACRERGDCLQTGEWDGAVGWTWGGKDRCDATDPRCGPNGQLRTSDWIIPPVPERTPSDTITHTIELTVAVGRDEIGTINVGLYGNAAPAATQQLVDLCSSTGLTTLTDSDRRMGATSAPVSLTRSGVVSGIVPGISVDFGIVSQEYAYARGRGLSKVEEFVPQPRPPASSVKNDGVIRHHDVAGLVSVPVRGVGNGGTGYEPDDAAFASSFLLTAADALPALDQSRRVIGQVLDQSSMGVLTRLAALPTKRGIRGVIPGQTSGPPLLKTVVRDVIVETVK